QQCDDSPFELGDRSAAAVLIRQLHGEGMAGEGGERLARAPLAMIREKLGAIGPQLGIARLRRRSRTSFLGWHRDRSRKRPEMRRPCLARRPAGVAQCSLRSSSLIAE